MGGEGDFLSQELLGESVGKKSTQAPEREYVVVLLDPKAAEIGL